VSRAIYSARFAASSLFYVPRSNPDGYSVNVRCLDPSTVKNINVSQFDGQNWEQHAGELSHLSSDEKQ